MASGPRIALRHPLLRVWQLEWIARVRQVPLSVKLIALLALTTLIAVTLECREQLVAATARHASEAGLGTGIVISVLMLVGRQRYGEYYSRGWLATLPVTRRSRWTIIFLRAAFLPMVLVAFTCGMAAVIWLTAPALRSRVGVAMLGINSGAIIGAIIGWVSARRGFGKLPQPPVTFGVESNQTASLDPLSGWAMCQTRAWLRPRILASSLGPVMLGLPMGISGNVAIAVLVVVALLLYLGALLFAVRRAVHDSGRWLRPTPAPFSRVAARILCRPLLMQLHCTLIASVLLIGLGCAPPLALRAAEFWLSVVTLTSGLSCARSHLTPSMAGRFILSMSVIAFAERVKAYVSLPLAVLITAMQIRKLERA